MHQMTNNHLTDLIML